MDLGSQHNAVLLYCHMWPNFIIVDHIFHKFDMIPETISIIKHLHNHVISH